MTSLTDRKFSGFTLSGALSLFLGTALTTLAFGSQSAAAVTLPKDEGANNRGGSAYFSWKVTNPISGLDKAEKTIGYACLTRDTIKGMAKDAYASRYAIKAKPKSTQWRLEFQEGISIRPDAKGQFKIFSIADGTSVEQLQQDITNPETGWIKRDFEMDGLGRACVQGGISSALQAIESTHNLQLAKPVRRGNR